MTFWSWQHCNSEILEYKNYRHQPRLFDEFYSTLNQQLEPWLWLSKNSSLERSGRVKMKASCLRCGLTLCPERSTSKDKMSTITSFWTPWQVAILDPARKTLNKTFAADGTSVLAMNSIQISQRWDYPTRHLTMGIILKSKRTFSGFQRSFTYPPTDDGLVKTIFWTMTGFAETVFWTDCSIKREIKSGTVWWDSSPDLNTKKLENSPNFPSDTYTASSDQRFRTYKILTVDIAAELYFWTEQWQNGSSVSSLGLAETPEVPNAKFVGNSLRFLMVYQMDPNG
jgi:hypothetical protein